MIDTIFTVIYATNAAIAPHVFFWAEAVKAAFVG